MSNEVEKSKGIAVIVGTVLAVGLIIFAVYKLTGVFSSIFESLGLKNTEADDNKLKIAGVAKAQDYFNPNFWRNPPKGYNTARVKYASAVKAIAEQIYKGVANPFKAANWNIFDDSTKLFTDNPQSIAAALNEMKNKVQVSQVAEYFAKTYKLDLYQFLFRELDKQNQVQIFNDIISRLNGLPFGWVQKTGVKITKEI